MRCPRKETRAGWFTELPTTAILGLALQADRAFCKKISKVNSQIYQILRYTRQDLSVHRAAFQPQRLNRNSLGTLFWASNQKVWVHIITETTTTGGKKIPKPKKPTSSYTVSVPNFSTDTREIVGTHSHALSFSSIAKTTSHYLSFLQDTGILETMLAIELLCNTGNKATKGPDLLSLKSF